METPRLPSAAHTHQASRPPRDTDCPQGKERPPGTRDGPPCPVLSAPPQGPDGGGTTTPPARVLGRSLAPARLPAHRQRWPQLGLQRGRRSHRQQKAKPPAVAPRAEHFLCLTAAPGSPARHAAAASVRSSVRSGLGAAGPTTLSSGGGVRGSALHAPREQSSRAEPWAERGAEGQLGAGAVCTPGVLPRMAPGKQTLSVRSV